MGLDSTALMRHATRMARSLLDLIMPRHCEICGARLGIDERLMCLPCNVDLPRTGDSRSICDNNTARLFWGRLPLERGASLMFYTPHTDTAIMIYNMKYHNRPDIGEDLGRMMAYEFAPSGFFDGIDLIIPMPLHWRRKRERGYNQCEEIACGIRSVTHIPVRTDIVARSRYTASQTKLSANQRSTNIKGAFELLKPQDISGRHVLLIDDIVTTGSTLSACGYEIARASGVRISILTVGRTKE